MAYVTVDTSGMKRHLARVKRLIAKGSDKALHELGKLGKNKARQLAPKDSGRTASLIRLQKLRTNQGIRYQIQAQNPTKGGTHRILGPGKYGSQFNLVKWMAETNGIFQSDNPFGKAGTKHIRTGDPRFMRTTKVYLNSIKKGVAQGTFKNINLR